jgi:hypothetical protein
MARDAAAGSFEFDIPCRPAIHIDHEVRPDGKFWESDLSVCSDGAADLLSRGSQQLHDRPSQGVLCRGQPSLEYRCHGAAES